MDQSRHDQAEFAQPLCTALQIGIVNLLRKWGVKPGAVLGHSSGEIAAAYACGAINLAAAIKIAYYRGAVARNVSRHGKMAAIGLSHAEVSRYLLTGVIVACDNSPNSVTLSGDTDSLHTVVTAIKTAIPNVFTEYLKVDKAYHTCKLCLPRKYTADNGIKIIC